MEFAEKFYVLHQGNFGKSAKFEEGSSPAEYSVISAPHPEKNACVVRKAICQSINEASWQANSEVTASDIPMIHDPRDLIQTSPWDFGVHMYKPEELPVRSPRAAIHLNGTTALALDKLIAKSSCKLASAIGAFTVHDNNLSSGRSLAEMLKKWPYQQCLVKDRNNDRELHSSSFHEIALQMAITQLHSC